jgi:hypothetical protein
VSWRLPSLQPLRREPPGGHTPASRLGDIVRALPDPPALDDAAHVRIVRRLRANGGAVGYRRGWRMRPLVAIASAACLVLLAIGAHAAVSWMRAAGILFADEPAAEAVTPPRDAPAARRAGRRPAEPAAPVVTPPGAVEIRDVEPSELAPPAAAPPEVPAVPPPPRAGVSRAPRPRPPAVAVAAPPALAPPALAPPALAPSAPAPSAPPAPSPSPLAHESRVLARVHDQLRARRDYAGALATLGEYDARFPAGVLRSEATLARLEALVAMGRAPAALSLLDEAMIRGPRALELLVLRGELRATAGRDAEAIADFDRVLERKPPEPLQRRALRGRAAAGARLGDDPGRASGGKR